MPEVVSCPECMSKLKVPEALLGKKVKCPKCTFSFLAVAVPRNEPPPEPEEEEAPPPRKRRAEDEDFGEERTAKRKPAPPPEEEEEEAPRSRRRRDEDEDEDREERPRGRKRREEDEDDYDRPRPRRRRDYDDDEDEFEDEPLRKRKRGKASDWQKVRMGIAFSIAGLFTMMGGMLVGCCGGLFGGMLGLASFAGGIRPNQQDPFQGAQTAAAWGTLGVIILMGGLGVAFIGRILEIVGYVFDIWAPTRRGAKILAIVTLVLAGLTFLSFCGGGFATSFTGRGPSYDPRFGGGNPAGGSPLILLPWAGSLLYFGEWVVFLFFLRSVALSFDDKGLGHSILCLIYLTIGTALVPFCMCGFVLLTFLGLSIANPQNVSSDTWTVFGVLLLVMELAFVIMACVALIWYIVSMFQVRGLLTLRLLGRR